MKIEIDITPKEFELANYILGQAIGELRERGVSRKNMDLTIKQVERAEKLRMKLVESFLAKHKK